MHSRLQLIWQPDQIPMFFLLLQKGFMLRVRTGSTIRTVLSQECGLDPHYVDKRISTIFLDGKPVDDIDKATVKEGSVLALSAAMPGFVGAALRKGGFYAAMRGSITHVEGSEGAPTGDGTVVLKLYNLLINELGSSFLNRGILLPSEDLEDFFKGRSEAFWRGYKAAQLDAKTLTRLDLEKSSWVGNSPLTMLTVQAAG